MLYIAARDIGNYKDNTERLKEILIKSDIILAESFREATTLFKILNINIDREKLVSLMSNNLQILRLKVDVSQEELADILGVTRQTISALETGQRNMSWTIFLALVLLFLKNKDTKHLMIALGIYTKELNEYLSL